MKILKKTGAILLVVILTVSLFSLYVSAEESEQASAVSFSIRTYNESRSEDDQNIEVVLNFDKEITVQPGAESDISVKIAGSDLDTSPNTENGASNRTLSVKADPADKTKLIITIGCVPGSQFIKQTNASIQIEAAEGGVSKILTAENSRPADIKYVNTIIPCGLALETVETAQGTENTPAYVSKKVSHRANVRSMVYIQVLKNGEPLLPTEKFSKEGSYIIHAHAFINTVSGSTVLPELTESDYAELIVQEFENSVKNLPDISSAYTMSHKDDIIYLQANSPKENESLDIRIYEWPVYGNSILEGEENNTGESNLFDDLSGWENEYVYYLADKGIVSGKTENKFSPLSNITRAEFVKMLAMASKEDLSQYSSDSFYDVSASAWYAPYVAWAEKHGIVNGSGGRFNASDNITKQDIAVMLSRYAENTSGVEIPAMEAAVVFEDDSMIASYCKAAVYQLQQASVVSGDINGKFYPRSSATRAQAAKMLAVFLQVTGR